MAKMKAYSEWGSQKITIDSIEPTHYVRNFLVFSTIKKIAKGLKIGNICEIGCGVGILSSKLGRQGFKVDAFDLERDAIALARQYSQNKNVRFFCRDVLKFSPMHKYGLVLSTEVLEHIKDDARAITNMSKILKKNGILIVTVPVNENYRTEFDNRSGHVRRYSEKELAGKLESNGFRIIKIKYFNFPLLWLWYFHAYLPFSSRKSKSKPKRLPFYVHALRLLNKVFLFDLLFNSRKATNIMVVAQKI